MKKILFALLVNIVLLNYAMAQDDEYSEEYDSVNPVLDISESNTETNVDDLTPAQNEGEKTVESASVVPLEPVATSVDAEVQQESADKAVESVSKSSEDTPKFNIHWIPISISAGVAVAGGVAAYIFDKKAKDATATPPANRAEFQKGHDDAKRNQNIRNVSLGVAAAGLVAIGLTFLF